MLFIQSGLEKAYDLLSWEFLFYMLYHLGIERKWINWMHGCLNSSWASVLVNGSPSLEFKSQRCLRQGDLLAPFLFLVVAKGFSGLIRELRNVICSRVTMLELMIMRLPCYNMSMIPSLCGSKC